MAKPPPIRASLDDVTRSLFSAEDLKQPSGLDIQLQSPQVRQFSAPLLKNPRPVSSVPEAVPKRGFFASVDAAAEPGQPSWPPAPVAEAPRKSTFAKAFRTTQEPVDLDFSPPEQAAPAARTEPVAPAAPAPAVVAAAPSAPEFRVRGRITNMRFANEEDSFYIFSVQRTGTNSPHDQVAIKGYGHELAVGQEVECTGVYEAGKGQYKDDLTLNCKSIVELIPTSLEGIRKLLHRGFVKGVGPKYADMMLMQHGADLFNVAEKFPQLILNIPGLGEARARAFISTVTEKRAVPRIMSFLAEIGLGPGLSHRVFKELGTTAVNQIKANPYALTRVPMVGFSTADKVARLVGIPPDSTTRIEAGIQAVLLKESDNGSTVVPVDRAIAETAKLLSYPDPGGVGMVTIPKEKISAVLDRALITRESVQSRVMGDGTTMLSLPEFVTMETQIALSLARLAHARTKAMRHVDMASPFFAHLDEDQKSAAKMALTSNVSVITGRPGSGKTTVTKSIIQSIQAAGLSYLACGPTGKAAKRFMEATGFQASTMHRALESKGTSGFGKDASNPFAVDFILADEQTMSDTFISHAMLKAVASGTQFLYIGDIEQLESIGAGATLRDIINSARVPVATLTKPHRQAAGSDIIVNAHRIIEGIAPFSRGQGSDFTTVNNPDTATQADAVVAQYQAFLAKGYRPDEIQILTPMRKKTDLGSNELNKRIKALINPGNPRNSIKRGKFENEVTFSVGDRVMQVANNKDLGIFNGDTGYIISMDKLAGEIVVDFSGERVTLSNKDLDDVEPAFVTTIHKSQGSEYPAVIIPVSRAHWMMWTKNLLYTATTRGKKDVALVGDMSFLKKIVATESASLRMTGLRDEIEQVFDAYQAKSAPRPLRKSAPSAF